jgi:hypothetical protein
MTKTENRHGQREMTMWGHFDALVEGGFALDFGELRAQILKLRCSKSPLTCALLLLTPASRSFLLKIENRHRINLPSNDFYIGNSNFETLYNAQQPKRGVVFKIFRKV